MTAEAGFAHAKQQPESERVTHLPHACAHITVDRGHALEVPASAARMSPPATRAHAREHTHTHTRITLLDGRRALVSALPRRARCVSHGPAVGGEEGGQVAGAVVGEECGDEVLAGESSTLGVSGARPPASGHLCYTMPDTSGAQRGVSVTLPSARAYGAAGRGGGGTVGGQDERGGEGREGREQGGKGRGIGERSWRGEEGRALESAGGRLSPYSRVITPIETVPSCVSVYACVRACVRMCVCVCARACARTGLTNANKCSVDSGAEERGRTDGIPHQHSTAAPLAHPAVPSLHRLIEREHGLY